MPIRIGGLTVLAALALVSPAIAGETIHVTIQNLKFAPVNISAHVGDTIEWTNKDIVEHSATALNKEFDVVIPANGVGRVTLARPGKIDYFCRFHPFMKGEIMVAP
jgi:plastocyanin